MQVALNPYKSTRENHSWQSAETCVSSFKASLRVMVLLRNGHPTSRLLKFITLTNMMCTVESDDGRELQYSNAEYPNSITATTPKATRQDITE
jgi:hypothetical protein